MSVAQFRSKKGAAVFNSVMFFFKQKTAYEMLRSLVGSEMCIRDSDSSTTKNCFGFVLVLSGQSLVPDPPAIIIAIMHLSLIHI